ncbi:NAD(P)H-binding protein [Kineococcus radiotolerans]|uniref:NmrA family protein n=1 Tax=Kineococcus radiotolerans (strain ATCC BAA-149 / DSM 14245 / SRS30216) TaxID=266940 RepID=A6W489_KINRD|nr:NAD(P)H-binding protein [Kineococcus radiotolerans]ABS01628.1 NmrA family protein [Kineococcus radiotolerans SRS30216 = ATCC BAA-149]
MIVVTGATGALNGATVDHLLQRVPASEVVVVARDVAAAQRFADRGIEVRHGDYADPASLPAAFAGADQLLLVSSSDPRADAVALHRHAVDAAVAVGAGRVLYTSHQGAAPGTPFGPGREHAATEELLAASGLPWTSLRNGFYAHSLDQLAGPWRETGRIVVPADGPVSWTAREDAAEAAAVILTAAVPHEGPVTLTAHSAPTFAQVAETASELTGRTVEVEVVDPEEWVAAQVAAGRPEFVARFALGMHRAAEEGFFAGVDPLLGNLLGREPRTVRDVLARPAAH